ncbi:hypothetical protein [Streptomyces tubercidicus]
MSPERWGWGQGLGEVADDLIGQCTYGSVLLRTGCQAAATTCRQQV